MPRSLRRLHVVGGKNHGKTTLIVELVAELTRRGLRVGTIKHTHHNHELDVPGKDSHRHREAGAAVVGILTPGLNAVFWMPTGTVGRPAPAGDARYDRFTSAFTDCDLLLVEGDTQTAAPKLEVWRSACDSRPLAPQLRNVRAIITDDPLDTDLSVFPRRDVPGLAELLLDRGRWA